MKTILELSHIKARQYFLESQNYCNMQFPKYIDFKPVIEYVQNSVGNKELRDILKDPKRMPSDYENVNHKMLVKKDAQYSYRPIQLINPYLYYLLVKAMTNKSSWKEIKDRFAEEELLTDTETEPEIVSEKEVPVSYTEIIEKVANWIKTDGYVQQGLTIKELSEILHTNRTYLSAYIKTTYKMTFREWITGLRLEYAKNILKEHPEINIQKLAESSGFLSRSNFIKSFTEKEGCTPGKWKKANLE